MQKEPQFVESVRVKGMYHALTVRSPAAKGVLKEIVSPPLPASFVLVTAKDIPGENLLADFAVPVLAEAGISYKGQPVAILAGPDENLLEEIASGVNVVIEEETPASADVPPGLIARRSVNFEEAEKILEESEKIISGAYSTGVQEHWYPEPHGAVAVPLPGQEKTSGKKPAKLSKAAGDTAALALYTATQWPYHVQRSVARVMGWDAKRIVVNPALLGEHLDGKLWYPSLVACHAALAARAVKKPVRLMLIREEDFLYSPKRNAAEIKIKSALGENGEIRASSFRIQLELGAQGVFGDELIDQTCLASLGVYRHGVYKLSGEGIRANIPPQGPMAGFGLSQGFFAAERHASRIADALGIDPAEWRKNNFVKTGEGQGIGNFLKNTIPLADLIDAAALMSDYYRKWASYELLRKRRRDEKRHITGDPPRGIGIAVAYQGNGFLDTAVSNCGGSAVEMTLEKDGSLEIRTSLVYTGKNFPDLWKDMAKDILGVDPALVRLVNTTDKAPDAGPSTLSRNITVITGLAERCLQTIRKQRFRSPLPITVKRSVKPGKVSGWVPETLVTPEAFARPSWCAAVAETEIDPVSFFPVIRGIWLAVDGGKIISQRRARRSLRTGIIQALGWTCRERIHYENGVIPEKLFDAFNLYAPEEIPPVHVDFIWNDTADPKGIGELPFCCIPAAFVQSVSQAMDHPFKKIPLTARDIWEAAKLKRDTP